MGNTKKLRGGGKGPGGGDLVGGGGRKLKGGEGGEGGKVNLLIIKLWASCTSQFAQARKKRPLTWLKQ